MIRLGPLWRHQRPFGADDAPGIRAICIPDNQRGTVVRAPPAGSLAGGNLSSLTAASLTAAVTTIAQALSVIVDQLQTSHPLEVAVERPKQRADLIG